MLGDRGFEGQECGHEVDLDAGGQIHSNLSRKRTESRRMKNQKMSIPKYF